MSDIKNECSTLNNKDFLKNECYFKVNDSDCLMPMIHNWILQFWKIYIHHFELVSFQYIKKTFLMSLLLVLMNNCDVLILSSKICQCLEEDLQ